MAAPVVNMQQLLEAGAHFGHQTHRWNPKMKPYIFGERNGVHIIDLSQTVPLFARALDFVRQAVARAARCCSSAPSARRRSRSPRPPAARASISSTIAGWAACSPTGRRSRLDQALQEPRGAAVGRHAGLTKKEVLQLTRERDKFELRSAASATWAASRRDLRDRRQQGRAGDQGSQCARHPGRRDLDSNSSPDGIAFPVPGNDDASRAIRLYCEAIASAAASGKQGGAAQRGEDIGRWKSRRWKPRWLLPEAPAHYRSSRA
jgi:small subunit ribosomal protein S2